jgi:hypothetical protein
MEVVLMPARVSAQRVLLHQVGCARCCLCKLLVGWLW